MSNCWKSHAAAHIQVYISWLFFFQVFLLTDGEVYNTKEVIGLVKANAEKAR